MKVHIYLSGNPVHDYVLTAFGDGCPEQVEYRQVSDYEPSDVAVVFGVYKSQISISHARGAVIANQRRLRRRTVVLETGYIFRGDGPEHYYAAGFEGLNGRADFRNQNSPADRWGLLQAQGVHYKPWRYGDDVMVCGQVPWDASVDHTEHVEWIHGTIARLKQITNRRIVFRPHPQAPFSAVGEIPVETGPVAWDRVHACVTFNSNTAVEAALQGVPVFVDDIGSMALRIANRNLRDIDNPALPSRQQWAYDLAYTQWTPKEMRGGLAWRHLFQ